MPFGSSTTDFPLVGTPLERVLDWSVELPRRQALPLVAALWGVVLIADAGTGRMVSLTGLYLLMLCFTTWCVGRGPALLAACLATTAAVLINGFGDSFSAQASTIPTAIAFWNVGMRICTSILMIFLAGAFRRVFNRERQHARVDPLTGLGNRRSFLIESRKLSLMGGRGDRVMLCGLIELDNFKMINVRHGHSAGDETLLVVAETLSGVLRPCDATARLGRSEFAFCLMVRNNAAAEKKSREIHEAVTAALTRLPWTPTCSLGASAQHNLHAAFCVADSALYSAKDLAAGSWRYNR